MENHDTIVENSPPTKQILCGDINRLHRSINSCIREIWHKGECNSEYGDPMMKWSQLFGGLVIICPICEYYMALWDSENNRWILNLTNLSVVLDRSTLECDGCGMYEVLLPELSAVEAFELEDEMLAEFSPEGIEDAKT